MTTLETLLSDLRRLDVKLWVENEALRYRAAKGTLSPELLAAMKQHKQDIVSFLRQAAANEISDGTIPPADRDAVIPLGFGQERLWFLSRLEPDNPVYSIPVPFRINGVLNVTVLEQSVNQIVQRHEILRTTFGLVAGQPCQMITPELFIPLSIIDLRDLPADQRESTAQRYANEFVRQPFQLEGEPLLRVQVIRLAPDEHILIWNMHSMICDGASADLFFQELVTLYRAISQGLPSPLADLPIQYADFAVWQRQRLQGETLDAQIRYWRHQLRGQLSLLRLPTDRPRLLNTDAKGDRCYRIFPKSLNAALNQLSQKAGVTLFMTLLAAFKALLYRYSGQADILVSFANAGRNRVEVERLIGFFGNTLVLRTDLSGEPTFLDLLSRVREVALGAYAHQDLPFEKLVEETPPLRSVGHLPLYQITFTLNPPWTEGRGMTTQELAPGLTIRSLFGYVHTGALKLDLALVMRETDQGLRALFEYNTELFNSDTILRLLDSFQILLEGIAANPNQPITKIPLLPPTECQRLLANCNPNPAASPMGTIQQRFEFQVKQTPEATALVYRDQQISYRALNQRANQFAYYLETLGVQPGIRVALCLEPTPELIEVLLGILKVGGVCIPLDPADSTERLSIVLEESQPAVLLTQRAHLEKLSLGNGCKLICLETITAILEQQQKENPVCRVTAQHLAYVMYSDINSYVGISILHRSVVALATTANYVNLTASEVLLQATPVTNGIALFEIWGSLLNGARLVLSREISTDELGQMIRQQQISTLYLPVGLLHRLIDQQPETLQSVHQILTGGGRLSFTRVRKLLQTKQCSLTYLYSLPENIAFTYYCTITDPSPSVESVLIGQPVQSTQIYVLDQHLNLVPTGVMGEIYIRGAAIAQGYFNRPDLTAQRFISNPFTQEANDVLFKSGHLGRVRSDGALEWLGSAQAYPEIKGLQLDLNRIAATLEEHPAVRDAVVGIRPQPPDEQRLIAYVVPDPAWAVPLDELHRFLKQKLPIYLIPDAFIELEQLPLTPGGAIDLAVLNQLEPVPTTATRICAPRDQVEQQLAQIWQQILNLPVIGIQDNFFELGGSSLLAVRMFTQIEKTFGVNLPLSALLKAATIESLATMLQQMGADDWSSLVEIQSGGSKPPLFCIHGGGFNVLIYRDLALNLGPDQPVYGLQAQGLHGRGGICRNRLEDIAADYINEIRTVQPHGPYYLSGLSNGGNIALEMAQQLQAQGEKVQLLALFDTYAPDSVHLLPTVPRFISSVRYVLRYGLPRFVSKVVQTGKRTLLTNPSSWRKQVTTAAALESSSETKQPSPFYSMPLSKGSLIAWMNWFSQYVLEHSSWSFLDPSAQLGASEDTISRTLKNLEKTYKKIYKAYRPSPYEGKAILFCAKETPPGYYIAPYLGWSQIIKEIEMYQIPGHHTSIMKSHILAEELKIHLGKNLNDSVHLESNREKSWK